MGLVLRIRGQYQMRNHDLQHKTHKLPVWWKRVCIQVVDDYLNLSRILTIIIDTYLATKTLFIVISATTSIIIALL